MNNKGIILAFVTAFVSGISIFSNALFVSNVDPLVFALLRNVIVAILLTATICFTRQTSTIRRLSPRQWGMLVCIGIIGGGIPFAMFFSGLSITGAVNGNVLQKTLFLWVALLAVPVLREKISKLQFAGYLTLFIGMFVIGGTYTLIPSIGTALVLGATILWAIEHIVAKVTLTTVSPLLVSWARMVFGLPCLLAACIIAGKTGIIVHPASYTVVPLLVSSIFLIGYMSSWYRAMKYAPVTVVSSILVFAPVVTAVLSSGIFHKAVPIQQSITYVMLTTGMIFIVIGAVRSRQHLIHV